MMKFFRGTSVRLSHSPVTRPPLVRMNTSATAAGDVASSAAIETISPSAIRVMAMPLPN